MKKILVAMSGGVDSAVAAGLLRAQGYEVGGGTMVLHGDGEREAREAAAAAARLGIPFHLFRWQAEFQAAVIEPFTRVYQEGGTPNPCIFCNKALKFGKFLDEALALGYDGIATGHYARLRQSPDGRTLLETAADRDKDQTYMLAGLSQFQLSHTVLPLGPYDKNQVRALAREYGLLEQAQKRDSQDICFVPDGDYMAYLTAHGLKPQPGNFIEESGAVLAPHRGFEAYTVGQRRGLELSAGRRVYVVEKRRPDVVIGEEEDLLSRRVLVEGLNWIPWDRPAGPLRAQVKLRYTQRTAPCTVEVEGDGAAWLLLDEPQRAVTPGQTAVLYDGSLVLGGGTIRRGAE